MVIAVLTSGILPVPAVQGGAAENLIDFYLEYNEQHQLHDITVFSVFHPAVHHHPALPAKATRYIYINRYSVWSRMKAKLYGITHRHDYYHYQLEYFFEQAYKILKRQHYDLIILENRPGYALKLRQRLNTPVISHIHTDLVSPDSPQVEALIKANDGFICVSEYIKSRILSVGLPTKAVVVYNGLDDKTFSPNHDNRKTTITRQSFGFNAKDFIVIYTGRIVPKKGVKELVEAIQLLKDEPDIKLLVVGGDNYADSVSSNPYLDELHEMGRKMGEKVRFTGFVRYEQLPAYLSLANVAVVPSCINEALGMTCIEACAMGLPVIATNDGGIPETLVGQKHILVDKDRNLPQQLADAILQIKDNYAVFTGNHFSPRFSKETYSETFFKAIEEYGI
ncbi:MAG: glycosyltransferase family 4 protein [Prevotella sp.]|nr:glycosyltransferase family 4 protein [Prevotella sp.]